MSLEAKQEPLPSRSLLRERSPGPVVWDWAADSTEDQTRLWGSDTRLG